MRRTIGLGVAALAVVALGVLARRLARLEPVLVRLQLARESGVAGRYALPKLKVDVALDRPYYQPAALVKGTVRASYVFGGGGG